MCEQVKRWEEKIALIASEFTPKIETCLEVSNEKNQQRVIEEQALNRFDQKIISQHQNNWNKPWMSDLLKPIT